MFFSAATLMPACSLLLVLPSYAAVAMEGHATAGKELMLQCRGAVEGHVNSATGDILIEDMERSRVQSPSVNARGAGCLYKRRV